MFSGLYHKHDDILVSRGGGDSTILQYSKAMRDEKRKTFKKKKFLKQLLKNYLVTT